MLTADPPLLQSTPLEASPTASGFYPGRGPRGPHVQGMAQGGQASRAEATPEWVQPPAPTPAKRPALQQRAQVQPLVHAASSTARQQQEVRWPHILLWMHPNAWRGGYLICLFFPPLSSRRVKVVFDLRSRLRQAGRRPRPARWPRRPPPRPPAPPDPATRRLRLRSLVVGPEAAPG